MIELYYWPTPNGHKVTMFLEEAGLDYTIHPVDISAGDQFKPDFLAISPNNRMPAIIDTVLADGGDPISVFESGAIYVDPYGEALGYEDVFTKLEHATRHYEAVGLGKDHVWRIVR
jgi:hypothetical protein